MLFLPHTFFYWFCLRYEDENFLSLSQRKFMRTKATEKSQLFFSCKNLFSGKCWVCRCWWWWLYCHIDSSSRAVNILSARKIFHKWNGRCELAALACTRTVRQNAVVMNFVPLLYTCTMVFFQPFVLDICISNHRILYCVYSHRMVHVYFQTFFCSAFLSLVYGFAANSVNCMCDRVQFV